MDLYEINQIVSKTKDSLNLLVNPKQLNDYEEEIKKIESIMLENDFYNNQSRVKKVTTSLKIAKDFIENYNLIINSIIDLEEYLEILKNSNDQSIYQEIVKEVKNLERVYSDFEISLLLNEEYDKNDAYLEIHSGAGGTESQDWVSMLYKMYTNYSKSKDFNIDIIDISYASDIGIKSLTMKVSGAYAYGLLKVEKGVHRLIRISPFDSSAKRHTTFALVSVSPVLEDLKEIVIDENDLEIDTYKSSGAGGQSVNTTESAVRIVHKPTKIVVTCQNQRSQLKNKQEALNILRAKLVELEIEKQKENSESFNKEVAVNFGSQIRTYVFHPYAMVKDHRSNLEVSNPEAVLNGDLDELINSVLRSTRKVQK